MEKIISIEVLFLSIDIFVSLVLSSRQIILTQLSQATNMLLISNKISINKNKQIFFSVISLFFSIDVLFGKTVITSAYLPQ